MACTVNPNVLFLGLTAQDLLISGGWFLTIIGWLVSNSQANSRERRKEVRAEIDACIKLQSDLVLLSRTYFGSPESDQLSKSRAAEIRFEMQRLITRVERLEKKYPQFDVTDAISGDPFESINRQALPADSDFLLKIESDTHVLIDQLENGFINVFR